MEKKSWELAKEWGEENCSKGEVVRVESGPGVFMITRESRECGCHKETAEVIYPSIQAKETAQKEDQTVSWKEADHSRLEEIGKTLTSTEPHYHQRFRERFPLDHFTRDKFQNQVLAFIDDVKSDWFVYGQHEGRKQERTLLREKIEGTYHHTLKGGEKVWHEGYNQALNDLLQALSEETV